MFSFNCFAFCFKTASSKNNKPVINLEDISINAIDKFKNQQSPFPVFIIDKKCTTYKNWDSTKGSDDLKRTVSDSPEHN